MADSTDAILERFSGVRPDVRAAMIAACAELYSLWPLSGYELEAYCGASLLPAIAGVMKQFKVVRTGAERHANAHLIAAAPELLAACQSFVASFHDHPDRDEVSMAMARAAIAKAEGR